MTPPLLGVDLGRRRIGLAVSEEGLAARPLATVARAIDPNADAVALRPFVRAHGIGALVVGLPLNADGSVGPMADEARSWAAAVGRALDLPIILRDERLSSHVAEGRVGAIGRGRSGGPPSRHRRTAYRARIDSEAAAVILQDELDARARADVREEGPR